MKVSKRISVYISIVSLFAISCNNDDDQVLTPSNLVDVGNHKLYTETAGDGEHTLVFESGLGDNYESWFKLLGLAETHQVIAYNRAGYEPSETATNERSIIQLAADLHQVILSKSKNNQVILVGHSLGGAVVRYYTVQHPEMVEGIVFVDPSHEDFEVMTQEQEDDMVHFFKGEGLFQIANEAEQFIENFQVLDQLSTLPNVPVVVLTSIKDREGEDEERWISAHATLGDNLTNFTHITTENSGHYIQVEEPQLVIDAIGAVLE
ncbi:alpha/beta fold hydrolase [Flagellimonas pacifica]|uniref:Pimeloyl-ACP methyl ester carboxylesterase n=1 Tax=Flagellimonas pacifica TaxID=1247520 RepID=A0A285MQK7_9FLAO|nr:alpha/beta hydrolase [Allomuricauda parva]SNY99455.1 Pimeloyl-ACP methyl ester carboxylesterase [Allomuricauda parva]